MRKYTFDYRCFENLTTEAQAYWLGFIMADGCVFNNSLRIELHRRDRSHLEKFKSFIQFSGEIKDSHKDCCLIELTHPFLVQDLLQYGIIPNKSKFGKFPQNIPEHLLKHYIRGLIDGDGWITKHKNKSSFTYEFGFSSGVEDVMNHVCNCLYQYIGKTCGTRSHRKRENQSCYQIIIGGRLQSQKLAKVLYENTTVYLDRKYDMAIEAMKGSDLNQRRVKS